MAPIGEKSAVPGLFDEKKEDDEDQNLWATILSEVQTSNTNKLPSCKSILVLGDNESGKTTLIAKLQGNDDPKKGSGLEYHYIDVRDEYRDDQTRLGVWVLDGDPFHGHLLRFAFSEINFNHTLILLVASMTSPWSIMESLITWATILQDHIDRLRISPEELREQQLRLVRLFQEYVEPIEQQDENSTTVRKTSGAFQSPGTADEDKILLPLGETTLTKNLGLPIIVVVTKTDFISNLEKDHDYKEEHFDFIQQYIRKFCLNYGAALFYTSVKEDKNCDLLYKYLVHQIYHFPFNVPALVVEKDAVFIPSGWDNEKKISILYDNMSTMRPDDVYSDVISKPAVRKAIQRDAEVQAEDEQSFLIKQQALLNNQVPAVRQESPMRTPAGVQKTPDRRMAGSPGVQGPLSSPKKVDSAKSTVGSEGVLANFFNSLLSKKTGASAGGISSIKTDKAVVHSEAAAELDRMTRSKKSPPGGQPTQNNTSP